MTSPIHRIRRVRPAAALAVLVALTACGGGGLSATPKVSVTDARVPLPASADVAAAYFSVHNQSSSPDELLSVTTDAAASATMHQTVVSGAVEQMVPAGPLTIAPGKTLTLSVGGYHVMLENPRALHLGDHVTLTLVFQRAGTVTVSAPVESAVAADNQMAHMPGM